MKDKLLKESKWDAVVNEKNWPRPRRHPEYVRGYWFAAGCVHGFLHGVAFPLFVVLCFVFAANFFGLFTDETDLNGFCRSGVSLVTDYGTGRQYLYRGGALVPRERREP